MYPEGTRTGTGEEPIFTNVTSYFVILDTKFKVETVKHGCIGLVTRVEKRLGGMLIEILTFSID